jgi:hypothetical protein
MYLTSLLYYLSWPALIIVSYYAILFVLKQYEKKVGSQDKN